MPLPAYLTEQPRTNPLDALAARAERAGGPIGLRRAGTTINMRGPDAEAGPTAKVVRMVCEYADMQRLTIEAVILDINGNLVDVYERAGFRIVMHALEDDEEGAHYLMRRFPRD